MPRFKASRGLDARGGVAASPEEIPSGFVETEEAPSLVFELASGPRYRGGLDGWRDGVLSGWAIDLRPRSAAELSLGDGGPSRRGIRRQASHRADLAALLRDNLAGFVLDFVDAAAARRSPKSQKRSNGTPAGKPLEVERSPCGLTAQVPISILAETASPAARRSRNAAPLAGRKGAPRRDRRSQSWIGGALLAAAAPRIGDRVQVRSRGGVAAPVEGHGRRRRRLPDEYPTRRNRRRDASGESHPRSSRPTIPAAAIQRRRASKRREARRHRNRRVGRRRSRRKRPKSHRSLRRSSEAGATDFAGPPRPRRASMEQAAMRAPSPPRAEIRSGRCRIISPSLEDFLRRRPARPSRRIPPRRAIANKNNRDAAASSAPPPQIASVPREAYPAPRYLAGVRWSVRLDSPGMGDRAAQPPHARRATVSKRRGDRSRPGPQRCIAPRSRASWKETWRVSLSILATLPSEALDLIAEALAGLDPTAPPSPRLIALRIDADDSLVEMGVAVSAMLAGLEAAEVAPLPCPRKTTWPRPRL